ncbi:RagB/SusD family nutrient uptake outer membrane protein [Dyadobacter sp. CY312]|uniref:RagB/SusD family nutrient uptake outer membrane protein n=1 Tax=Dyadobacter sp. CY312 TaxID=2907303 RepID=UPI001F48C764|nr:RagB/SusD family nutrient uptake outer membrane protein [Dyadobacter sp. CY312]MCE7040365.1 RagB/SusD family nutrient uptake outer membrane protein [Dyadobacter sp. CY312]
MKNRVIYLFTILAFIATGCNEDYLNRLPLDEIADETFWNTEEQLTLAANGCYANIKAKNTVDMENMGDNTLWPSTTDFQLIGSGNFNVDLGMFNTEWRNMYAGIRQCNTFLENYQKAVVPVEARKEILAAEVRVIRAYMYSYLVLFWGDVPLVTKPLNIDELYEPRTPSAQVVDFILAELDAAAAVLPKEIAAGKDLGRLRKGAALGLKARVALYFGKYDVAEKAAKDVMDLNVYQLFSNGNPATSYNNYFTYAGKLSRGNNKETIIARTHLEDLNMHNLSREIQVPDQNARFNPTRSLVDSYLCKDGLPIEKSPLYKETSYQDVFTNRDPRMTQTIFAPNAAWGGRYDGNPENTNPAIFTAPKFRSDRRGSVTITGYYFTKYVEPTTVAQVSRDANDIHVLRYAEVLLTYAEAKMEQGTLMQADLDISINLLRNRVGMKPMILTDLATNNMNIRDEIRRERRVELALEGQRYFDIKRWKQGAILAQDVKGMKKEWAKVPADVANIRTDAQGYIVAFTGRNFAEKHYLWPVPLVQIERNPALGQNPGWE